MSEEETDISGINKEAAVGGGAVQAGSTGAAGSGSEQAGGSGTSANGVQGQDRKEFRLELNGVSCGACEKIIERVAEKNDVSIVRIDANAGVITVKCEEGRLGALKKGLAEKGFGEKGTGTARGDPAKVLGYISAVLAGEKHVGVESKLLNYALASAVIIVLLTLAGQFLLFGGVANSMAYAPLFLLVIGTSVLAVFSYQHMLCFCRNLSCSNGMMAGMTLGMMAGFMAGALVGATNGMFMGSLVGMAVGIALGANVGRFCGVMGAMEGIMAGLMAGTMGAMLSVMMVSNNLLLFLYILFGICAFLLGGLSYMMYREAGSAEVSELRISLLRFAGMSSGLAFALIFIMLYGPKSGIIYP
ncbi:MAG: hypothetical protein Q7T16_04120 [Candidatus Burarchaeum sp.]|nr:hypothetical protein [Candidatus Burarchaeum sp.]MDO8339816.1 hypothetical protein [Candidatus Burarchaeum sp.]